MWIQNTIRASIVSRILTMGDTPPSGKTNSQTSTQRQKTQHWWEMHLYYEWQIVCTPVNRSSIGLGKGVVGCHLFTLSSIMAMDKNRSHTKYIHSCVGYEITYWNIGTRHFFRINWVLVSNLVSLNWYFYELFLNTGLAKGVVGCYLFTLSSLVAMDKNRSHTEYMHALVIN